jgi:hypothetical protein
VLLSTIAAFLPPGGQAGWMQRLRGFSFRTRQFPGKFGWTDTDSKDSIFVQMTN